jgi:hypothetical protein
MAGIRAEPRVRNCASRLSRQFGPARCDATLNLMECNHRKLGHVEAGESGFEKEMRISHT